MKIQVKDIVNLPEKKQVRYENKDRLMGRDGKIKTTRHEIRYNKEAEIYNQALSNLSTLELDKDKVIGLVIFDREKLASELFLAKRGDHAVIEIDKIQIMEESYREADFIIHAKSDILTIKGDV